LTWWRSGGITLTVGEVRGWVAEKAPGGATLVARPARLPGTNIPDRATGAYLAAPFQGSFGIGQLWGENPQIYNRITYDGVPLKGHNGIDFLTPTGTNIVATADGVVQEAVFNDPSGFGHYVKLGHSWGESIYAHLEAIAVQVGQRVGRGQVIGRSGSTGFSSGPHLHFAIRINPYSRTDGWGGFSDPLPYMRPSDVQLPSYVRDMPPGVAAAPMAQEKADLLRDLARAPGYAPDQPGVRRP
jgi:murein DD-endopeptidase MepM/ murein hydrolase activator NlpD